MQQWYKWIRVLFSGTGNEKCNVAPATVKLANYFATEWENTLVEWRGVIMARIWQAGERSDWRKALEY